MKKRLLTKKYWYLLSFIFLLGCKEEPNPGLVLSDFIFSSEHFKVAGVNDENITIVDKKIYITLPADYPYGNLIKPSIIGRNGCKLVDDVSQGIFYEGREVRLRIDFETYGEFDYQVSVIPTAPLIITPGSGDLEITVEEGASADIPVKNMGSAPIYGQDEFQSNASGISLKNKATGEIFSDCRLELIPEPDGSGKFRINFPVNVPAGSYEASVNWGGRTAKMPDLIHVKYGKLALNYHSWIINKDRPELTVGGYNLYPENEYEIELKNDFSPVRRLKLARRDYNNLAVTLPADLAPGNYNAKVLVNSKEYEKRDAIIKVFVNLTLRSSALQPVIVHVSQPSLVVPGECYYYKEATVISRNEDMIAKIQVFEQNAKSRFALKLVNRETKKEYLLTTETPRFSTGCNDNSMSQFAIPAEVSNGTYEVYAIVSSDEILTSERLAQIITIQ